MRKLPFAFASLGIALVAVLNVTPAWAQIPHTYVMQSGSGTACTYAAPCAVVQTAINATSNGGDVYILDGDYSENLVITQSIGITGNLNAGVIIRATTTNGTSTTVTINAPNNANVTLSNLSIYPDLNGVVFNTGRQLNINSGTNFTGASNNGLIFSPNTPASGGGATRLRLSSVSASGTNGAVLIKPTGGVVVVADVDNLKTNNSLYGVRVDNTGGSGAMKVDIENSTAFHNTNIGYVAVGTGAGGPITMVLSHSSAVANSVAGAVANGAQASLLVTASNLTNNGVGLACSSCAVVDTDSNNALAFNGADYSGTITPISLK